MHPRQRLVHGQTPYVKRAPRLAARSPAARLCRRSPDRSSPPCRRRRIPCVQYGGTRDRAATRSGRPLVARPTDYSRGRVPPKWGKARPAFGVSLPRGGRRSAASADDFGTRTRAASVVVRAGAGLQQQTTPGSSHLRARERRLAQRTIVATLAIQQAESRPLRGGDAWHGWQPPVGPERG